MKLIVGLGNPGAKYEWTRHNAGFLVLDALLKSGCNASKPKKGKGPFQFIEMLVGPETIVLVKPALFMNESGIGVHAAIKQFEPTLSDCLLVSDDINLPLGRLRFRTGGSSGGHKGLESVFLELQTQEIPRLRFGVGGPPTGMKELSDYVLAPILSKERVIFEPELLRAADACLEWVRGGADAVMQKFN